MTAEQALIEENKKDPRKKYITKDINGNTEFWAAKPFINHETGQWKSEGFLISIVLNDIEIDFSRKDWQECILCIEDIKISPIPEKWYIECTEENIEILNGWRLNNAKEYLDYNLEVGYLVVSKNIKDDSLYFSRDINSFKDYPFYKDYEKITLEQFKKYVLCEGEEKQEETQNHASQAPPAENINTSTHFYSTICWIEDRINYINQFIKRNIDSDLCINPDWVTERNELIEKLKNL